MFEVCNSASGGVECVGRTLTRNMKPSVRLIQLQANLSVFEMVVKLEKGK